MFFLVKRDYNVIKCLKNCLNLVVSMNILGVDCQNRRYFSFVPKFHYIQRFLYILNFLHLLRNYNVFIIDVMRNWRYWFPLRSNELTRLAQFQNELIDNLIASEKGLTRILYNFLHLCIDPLQQTFIVQDVVFFLMILLQMIAKQLLLWYLSASKIGKNDHLLSLRYFLESSTWSVIEIFF